MGARSRRKGRTWEQELTHILRGVYPAARRGIGQARSGGEVCDVEGTPWWVEAKVGARTNPRAAVRQAEQATDGRPVLAICKDNQEKPGKAAEVWVTLRLQDFLALAAQAEGKPWPPSVEGQLVSDPGGAGPEASPVVVPVGINLGATTVDE